MEPGHTICQVRVPLAESESYLRRLSRAYPETLFEILSFLPLEQKQVVVNYRITGDAVSEGLVEAIRDSKDVSLVEVIEKSPRELQLRVESDVVQPGLMTAVEQHRLLPEFPAYVRDGMVTAVVVAANSRIKSLLETLQTQFPGTKVLAIRHEGIEGPRGVLSDRQLAIFRSALQSGYWDVPRRTSLTELAERMNTSKSSLSETLAHIEKKLINDLAERYLIPA